MIVILDGMDFTGKTTMARRITREFENFERIAFPKRRNMFDDVFRGEVEPYSAMLLFTHDYIRHVRALDPQKNYVFDRSFVSTFIYQAPSLSVEYGISLSDAFEIIYNIYFNPLIKYHPRIDEIFILKVSPEEYIRRAENKIGDVFEQVDFQSKLYKITDVVYDYLSQRIRGVGMSLIDTTNISLNEVYEIVKNVIKSRLAAREQSLQLVQEAL